MMDVTSGGGYLYKTSGLDFVSGNCDVCKQKNVKVTPFHCKTHYYCRSCLEFAPKFRRSKDFSCPTCCDRSKRRTAERREEVDKFMRTQTDNQTANNFDEVLFSVGGSSFVSWDNESAGSDEESDLTGNNDEWDNLLETMSRDKQQQQTTSSVEQTTEIQSSPFPNTQTHKSEDHSAMTTFTSKPGIMGIAPATSYLQLRLPTADICSSQSSGSSSSAIGSTHSQTSSLDNPSKTSSTLLRANYKNKMSRSVSSVSNGSGSKSSDSEDGNRLEVKGSGTVDGRYRRQTRWLLDASPEHYLDERKKRPNTPVSTHTSSSPDCQSRLGSGSSFECWMEDVGRIEGPSFKDADVTFSSLEKLPEVENDDFWDM